MKSILVTGGCGFLGKYLLKNLIRTFHTAKFHILDLKSNDNTSITSNTNPRINFHLDCDITNYDSLHENFKNIDIVIHLAGLVSFNLKDKENLYKVNVKGTENVAKACLQHKVKHLFHISSVAALGYKDNPKDLVNEQFKFNWKIAKKRKKYYMLTKFLGDQVIKTYRNKGLKATILYPGLMWGPGDVTNSSKLIRAIKNKKIPFNMPGGTNIIDVRDVARGIAMAVRSHQNQDMLLSGYNLSFTNINNTIASQLSVPPPSITLPKIANYPLYKLLLWNERLKKTPPTLPADNFDSACKLRYFTNQRAKHQINWQPKIPFEQTIQETIEWMQKNDLFKE
jgi:nucleoside-diphosphate-sugar epimerase